MKHAIVLCVLCCALAGCQPKSRPDVGAEPTVWVVATFSGGRQCAPHEDYTPPQTSVLLGEAGVEPLELVTVPMNVCMACDCPVYAAEHYARIPKPDLAAAEQAGFALADPPTRPEEAP